MTGTPQYENEGAPVRLVVNADDLGLSTGVNDGILESHRNGIVTSASLMVRRDGAQDAAARLRYEPSLSVGLHFDLGDWVYRGARWVPALVFADADDESAVEAELDGQLAAFGDLLGRGPTHIDSHQHVHRGEPVRSVLVRAAAALGIPLRENSPAVRYSGAFYGQAHPGSPLPELIGVPALLDLLHALPAGTTELGCHPGRGTDIPSEYAAERERETRTLTHPAVRRRIAELGIELLSFHDFQTGATVR